MNFVTKYLYYDCKTNFIAVNVNCSSFTQHKTMNLNYKELLQRDMDPTSKVWIYQATRLLSIQEALLAEDLITEFINQWESHGKPVKGAGHLFFGQFVILIADDTQTHVGGCSTDSSLRFIKLLQEKLQIDFLDRNLLAFLVNDTIQTVPYAQLQYAIDNAFITPDTLYFNNLVNSLQLLEDKWIIPVKESWLANKIQLPQ